MHAHTNVVSLFPPGLAIAGSAPAVSPPTIALTPSRVSADVHLSEIASRLGIADESWRGIIDKVRVLNDRYGFPDPKNPRFLTHKGERTLVTGSRAIVRRSVFPRARVEEWFDNHRSPAQRASEDRDEARMAARDLAANARNLVASLSGRKQA